MGRLTRRFRVLRRLPDGDTQSTTDLVAVEEPLELRAAGRTLTVTMRTPGHDVELAHGWLLSEGVIAGPEDVRQARYCAGTVPDEDGSGRNTYNVLDLDLAPGVDAGPSRRTWTSSACGVCGVDGLAELTGRAAPPAVVDEARLDPAVLTALPGRLRQAQPVFDRTGGTHAAGLFTVAGRLLAAREDVGRHNAVDKVLGWALLQGLLPLSGTVLVVSSRVSYELVAKSARAGVPILAALSAPSSLALEAAEAWGVSVASFVRDDRFNVCAHPRRIRCGPEPLDLPAGRSGQ